MPGESEFNICIASVKLFQLLQPWRDAEQDTWSSVGGAERKMHWRRWKQLLISVSGVRGGEAAVCRAGEHMSSLSSVTHQLKIDFFFFLRLLFCCVNQFLRSCFALYPLASKAAVLLKALACKGFPPRPLQVPLNAGISNCFLSGALSFTSLTAESRWVCM